MENALGMRTKSLDTLNLALSKQPDNELCRYNRAHTYYCMDKCKARSVN